MKTGSIVAVALLPLWLGVADAAKGSEQDASKILSPKAALKKALVAVGTPDEMKPELEENQKNGRASIPTLELMQLEEFAYEMKDRYEALGANDTDGERSLLRSLQSGEPDCSVTSTGAVKCCQASQGGNDLCIHFDCPVQGQLSDACTCRVQVNGYFCDSCSLCGDDGMDFDCNNVQYGMAANVCPNDSDSYSDVYGNDSDEEYYSDIYGNDSEPDSDSYSSGGGGGDDDELECAAVAGGGVQCCGNTDDGIYGCMTFYCSGGELTDDCSCSLSLNGNTCRECDICPGGDGDFSADCSNIGGGSLPACSDAGVGSDSNNPGSGGNGMGNNNGGGSGSGTGSGSGSGLGGFFGGGNNEGGNGGSTNGGGTANAGGTTNGGGTSGDGGGSTGNGGFSFPWSQQTASSAPSAGLAATSAIAIGGAVMAAF